MQAKNLYKTVWSVLEDESCHRNISTEKVAYVLKEVNHCSIHDSNIKFRKNHKDILPGVQ